MNALLLRNARLIDPEAGEKTGDLFIKDGVVADIGPRIDPSEGTQIVDVAGKCLGPGLVDVGVQIGEPGARHKESFGSASEAAAAGGVTTIVARPDTDPPIDSPEMLDFVTRRAAEASRVRIRHMAALTKGREGREMAEIGFLRDLGAVAFWDGLQPVANTKVYARALSYARAMGALIFAHPQEGHLSKGAVATSGKVASLMGLPAVSPMAERMGIDREIGLVEMTGARMHLDQITTARALPPLQRAKANGLDLTASTSIHHVTLNALDIDGYRSFFKLTPPLRSEDDRQAIIEALRDGSIDWLASFHTPQDEETKRLPFEEAAAGAVGLETLLPAGLRLVHGGVLDLAGLFRLLSTKPAQRLGLPGGRLSKGAPADLVVFDPDAPFRLDRWELKSRSKNTPFDGALMQGRVLTTFVGGTVVYQAAG